MILTLFAQSILLSGGTVHSMEQDATPVKADVLIIDGLVTAVGPAGSLEVPGDARVFDASGKHIVPGLIDGMVNHDPDHDLLYLSAGITVVRDVGNSVGRILMERKREARDRAPGPDLYVAGPVIDGDPPSTTEAAVMRSAAEVEIKMTALYQSGIDYISIHEGIPREAWEKLLEFGHERDLTIWGPVPRGLGLEDVLEKGQDGLFGMQGLMPAGRAWRDAGPEDVLAALEAVGDSDIAITPLLGVYARIVEARDEAALEWLSPHYEIGWRSEGDVWTGSLHGEVLDKTENALAMQRAAIRRLADAGCVLVPGSASPNSWLLPGDALHDELGQWVEAGFEPYEALHAATAGAAKALGIAHQRGGIRAGLVADLVVTDSDPRLSIESLRRPEAVIIRGRMLERAELDQSLSQLKDALVKVREELAGPIEVDPPDVPDGDTILAGKAVVEAYGQPVSAERFQVVRTYDGRTAYCTRLRIPDTATKQGSELQLIQRFYEGRLEGFDLRIAAGEEYSVEGRLLGGLMNVQRRLGRQVIDSKRAHEPISLVDVSSVLTPLLIAQQLIEGPSFVLMFRGLDTATDRWILEIDPQDHRHNVKTTDGWLVAGFDSLGVPLFQFRRTGSAQTVLRIEEAEGFGGPGLALAAERVFVPGEEVEASEASTASSSAAQPPAQAGEGGPGDEPESGETPGETPGAKTDASRGAGDQAGSGSGG